MSGQKSKWCVLFNSPAQGLRAHWFDSRAEACAYMAERRRAWPGLPGFALKLLREEPERITRGLNAP